MFEKSLIEKFERIFDMKCSLDLSKIKFTEQGYSGEQECLFIEIASSRNSIKEKRQVAHITGQVKVFANADKLPFGYFSKKIAEADPDDTHDLFFYDIEDNSNLYLNVVQRTFSFRYFFDSQYNPSLGTITSVDLTTQVSE
jgi:hypothetical protein